jgi:hypothetical protein
VQSGRAAVRDKCGHKMTGLLLGCKPVDRLSLLRSFLVRFYYCNDPVDFIETFDIARHGSCCRAVLAMCLK